MLPYFNQLIYLSVKRYLGGYWEIQPKSEIYGPLYRKKTLGHVSHTTGLRPRADLMSNAAHGDCKMLQWDKSHFLHKYS